MTWRLPTGEASNTGGLIQITSCFAHMELDGTRIMTAKKLVPSSETPPASRLP